MAVTSLLLCSTVTLYTGAGPLAVSLFPRGICKLCCPTNLHQDVSFLLYTRRNPRFPQRLFLDGHLELNHSLLRRNHSTVFYIHGFTELSSGRSSQAIKSAFLSQGDYNVILVDWSPLSAAPWYLRAADNTRLVGHFLARFIRFLNQHAVPVRHIHVVGFSLGAEIAGFAGKALHDMPLPRISGLDPAYPLYMFRGRQGHLVSTDAQFVDVIHTDGGVFGFKRPLGHVDFYPNGGKPFQPGCRLKEKILQHDIQNYIACSHNRAWAFFAESVVRPTGFPAVRCQSYTAFQMGLCPLGRNNTQYMGITANPRLQGKFYLRTRDRPPFSLQTRPSRPRS